MDFFISVLGSRPSAIDMAIDLINRSQTIWRLIRSDKVIIKPDTWDTTSHISAICRERRNVDLGNNFIIGVTRGRVDMDSRLSYYHATLSASVISEFKWKEISEFEWRATRSVAPPEVFWALALANICFRVSINNNCKHSNCIGYNDYKVDGLLAKLVNLNICNNCQNYILKKYKYQLSEITGLIDVIRKPMEYQSAPIANKTPLHVLENQVARQVKSGNSRLFEPYGIVILMHFLLDLIPFIEGLMTLGAKEEAISLLVKPYPYGQRTRVHSILCQQYPKIRVEYLESLPPEGYLVDMITTHCRDNSSGKILIIEDGGYIVPYIHKKYNIKNNFCIGAVEQTTKGLRRDKEIKTKKLLFPILDVAKSDFKDEYESPLVGRAVVSSIQRLLPEDNWSGKTALVFGFGAIGREVAVALRAIGMIVSICDSKAQAVAAARVRGYRAELSPVELALDADLIVGTTGELSIKKDTLDNAQKSKVIIASTSSELVEVDIDYLQHKSADIQYVPGLGTNYIRKRKSSQITYVLLADGFPVNFYLGSGIPNEAIDPILAQMIVGAIHIAMRHKKLDRKIQSDIMDELIEKFGLIHDFLATFSH